MANSRDLSWLTRSDLHPKADQALLEEYFEWTRAWHQQCLEGISVNDFLEVSLHQLSDKILTASGYSESFPYQYFTLVEIHISHLIAFGQADEAFKAAEDLEKNARTRIRRIGDFFDQRVFVAKRHKAAASRQLGRVNALKLLGEARNYLLERPDEEYIRTDLPEPLDLRETNMFKRFCLDLAHEETRIRIRDVLRSDTTHNSGRFPETVLPLMQTIRQFMELYSSVPHGQRRPMLRDTHLRAEIFWGGSLEKIQSMLTEETEKSGLPWAERLAFTCTSALAHYFAHEVDEASDLLKQCRHEAQERRLLRAVQNADDLLCWLNLE